MSYVEISLAANDFMAIGIRTPHFYKSMDIVFNGDSFKITYNGKELLNEQVN